MRKAWPGCPVGGFFGVLQIRIVGIALGLPQLLVGRHGQEFDELLVHH